MQYIAVSTPALFLNNLLTTEALDINPNNIFLSGIDGPSPVVKVGELGNSEYLRDGTLQTTLIC